MLCLLAASSLHTTPALLFYHCAHAAFYLFPYIIPDMFTLILPSPHLSCRVTQMQISMRFWYYRWLLLILAFLLFPSFSSSSNLLLFFTSRDRHPLPLAIHIYLMKIFDTPTYKNRQQMAYICTAILEMRKWYVMQIYKCFLFKII